MGAVWICVLVGDERQRRKEDEDILTCTFHPFSQFPVLVLHSNPHLKNRAYMCQSHLPFVAAERYTKGPFF